MKKLFSFCLVVFVLAIALTFNVSAVRITTPTGIETWLIACVPNTGGAVASGHVKDWIKENGGVGEAALSDPANGPEAGDVIGNIDPKYGWKEVKGDKNNNFVIDFQRADIGWGDLNQVVAYMYIYVTSDRERKVTIYGGSDDCLKVFVNGKMVWDNPALRGVGPNQDEIKDITLKPGKNGILFKITEEGGGWGGWGRIEPIEGLKVSTTKKADGNPIPEPITKNIFFDEFLMLIGPNSKAGAALEAHKEDLIATWSGGKYTEAGVAAGKGVARGVMVGKEKWTEGKITNWGGNNLQVVAEEVFKRSGDQNDITWYGYTVINSPDDRDVELKFGSDDSVKAWLNGKVIHDNPVLRGSSGFQDTAKVKLNRGPNTLLVKVCEQGGGWSGFVGFTDAEMYRGLIVDSSLTPVSHAGKVISKWGDIKNK